MSNKSKVTLLPEFNLSQLYTNSQADEAVPPTKFINSQDCKNLLKDITGRSEPQTLSLYLNLSAGHYYTHSKWLFLAYVRHCFGNNLDNVIANVLSEVVA